jgi:hypothetical protein
MKDKPQDMTIHDDVARLVGSTVIDVKVGMYCVDFVFLGQILITLRLKKWFEFNLIDSKKLTFDPTSTLHNDVVESTKFILLHGLRCISAQFSGDVFQVIFENNARLWVDVFDNDFEPLELIGSSGTNFKNLEFYHVL